MTNQHSRLHLLIRFAAPVLAAVLCLTSNAQMNTTMTTAQDSGLTVTYIAHCGFLFSSGEKKILTDALTEPSKEWPYDTPSPDLLKKMERGEPPFDHINVVLISHNHIDHESPASIVRFLLNNPKTLLVTTPEVKWQMENYRPEFGNKFESQEFKNVRAQVVVPILDWKQSNVLEVNGIKLEIARLKHTDDKEWPSIVYAALFDLGGKKVLFAPATTGYFPEEYKIIGYAMRSIDLAFVNFDLAARLNSGGSDAVLNTAGIQTVRERIAPKVTVLMHVGPGDKAFAEKILPDVQKQLPGTIWFRHELETRTF